MKENTDIPLSIDYEDRGGSRAYASITILDEADKPLVAVCVQGARDQVSVVVNAEVVIARLRAELKERYSRGDSWAFIGGLLDRVAEPAKVAKSDGIILSLFTILRQVAAVYPAISARRARLSDIRLVLHIPGACRAGDGLPAHTTICRFDDQGAVVSWQPTTWHWLAEHTGYDFCAWENC